MLRLLRVFAPLALLALACGLSTTPPTVAPSATFVPPVVTSPTPDLETQTPVVTQLVITQPVIVTQPVAVQAAPLIDVNVQPVPAAPAVAVAVQPLNVPLPANCVTRTDWQPYVVQPGDTVGLLAINTNTPLADLVIGNCLATPDLIQVGQTLVIPRAPLAVAAAPAVSVSVATAVPGQAAVAVATVSTTNPVIGQVLVEPALTESGRYLIAPGRVTVRAQGVANAQRVSFYMAPTGTDSPPTLIGTDDNLADGANIQWQVGTPALLANVWAVAESAGGAQATSNPILVANNG